MPVMGREHPGGQSVAPQHTAPHPARRADPSADLQRLGRTERGSRLSGHLCPAGPPLVSDAALQVDETASSTLPGV